MIKLAKAIDMMLFYCELFYIVYFEEILNHNTFPLLRGFELCSSNSNNCGGECWFSDTTNLQVINTKSNSIQFPLYAARMRQQNGFMQKTLEQAKLMSIVPLNT